MATFFTILIGSILITVAFVLGFAYFIAPVLDTFSAAHPYAQQVIGEVIACTLVIVLPIALVIMIVTFIKEVRSDIC